MKLRIEVREDEFTLYCEGIEVDTFPFEPDTGYITPCFTYGFIWDHDRTVVVCYDEADTVAILDPGNFFECEASMEDPKQGD